MKVADRNEMEILLGGIRPREPFGARDHALLRLALATALRSCELCGLNVNDVWSCGKAKSWLLVRSQIAKGGHALFLSKQGSRLTSIAIAKMLQAYAGDSCVGPRLLHRSWQAHRRANRERRLPGL